MSTIERLREAEWAEIIGNLPLGFFFRIEKNQLTVYLSKGNGEVEEICCVALPEGSIRELSNNQKFEVTWQIRRAMRELLLREQSQARA